LTLASSEVPVMIGLRLFLPESWTSDAARMDHHRRHRHPRTGPSRRSAAKKHVLSAVEVGGQETQALGRSRGGFGTKISVVVEALGLPVRFDLGPGQQNDMACAADLIDGLNANKVLADRAYAAARWCIQTSACGLTQWLFSSHAPLMRFFSDNAALVHPKVMQAMADVNGVDTAYDGDQYTVRLDAEFSKLFDHDVAVLSVATGTAANCLALSLLCQPHQGIICHREAHIEVDECGAPGFYTGGAKLMLVDGDGAKLSSDAVSIHLGSIRDDVHQVQAAALSITNATEYGLVYAPGEVKTLSALCKQRNLGFHMDGARFANAVASAGCHPADVTVRAGVDVLSFGFAKNGGMGAEALVCFDPSMAHTARYRRKRAGHLQSKNRFLAAQLLAMLDGDLWLKNAQAANAAARIIAESAGDRLMHPVQANEIFITLTSTEAAALRAQGFDFYDWGDGAARLVTSWHHQHGDVAPLAKAIASL
jgi:threonine aldolase